MLSTKTNLEITEYHEKFFLGLSLRQLACFGVAAVLAIASCFVCLQWLQLDIQLVSYIVMVEVLPFLGLGLPNSCWNSSVNTHVRRPNTRFRVMRFQT